MKISSVLFCVCLFLVNPFCVVISGADLPDNAIKISGKITRTKHKNHVPLKGHIKTKDGRTFFIVMDEKGRSFTKVMHRENAEIREIKKNITILILPRHIRFISLSIQILRCRGWLQKVPN